MIDKNLPCYKCIVLSICIGQSHTHMFTLINQLGNKCSLLYDYLSLKDTDIDFPEPDAPREEKVKFNLIQKPRIVSLHNYMKWPHNLDDYLNNHLFKRAEMK